MKNKTTNPARRGSNTKPNHVDTNTVTDCGLCN